MIFDFLVSIIVNLIGGFLDLLPDIPDMPDPVAVSAQWLVDQAESVAGIIVGVLGAPIYGFVLIALLTLLLFEPAYHAFHWILRKIPVSSH
jgi:hypothetical protein